jgi:hypothetical protein
MVMRVFLLFILLVSSCAKKNETYEEASPLSGTWSRTCEPLDPSTSFTSKLKFSKNDVNSKQSFFGDNFCSQEFLNFEITYTGVYAIGDKIPSGAANQINYSSLKNFLTIKSDVFVGFANSENLFGFSNWVKNVEKDITGKDSDGGVDVAFSKRLFDIFAASNTVLCFGLDTDEKSGTLATTRPTKLDTDCFFRGELLPPSTTPLNTLAALGGRWQTDCEEDDDSSSLAVLEFEGSTFESTHIDFEGTDCNQNTKIVELRETSSIEIGENTLKPSGATEIDFIQRKTFVTIRSSDLVTAFNNVAAFGYSDWAINAEKEITGKNTDGTADTTPNIYSIFKRVGDSLCLGIEVNDDDLGGNSENDDGSGEAKRHSYLDNNCFESE